MLESGYLFDQRYQLKEIIGEGGMSQVWRALDTLLQTEYAIKVYLSHLSDPKARETIREEFKILKDLNHPNIIRHEHFGIDRDNDLPYIVTTLYEKGSAASILNKSGVALDEMVIARFMHDAAQSLEFLGSQNPPIVHQDIKPDNFLIDGDGNYVLSDFGISIRKRETRVMSLDNDSSGNWAGDQAYLAPERFKRAVPRQSQDIFSLGVTLFEIASGVLPFGEMGGILLSSGAGKPELDAGFGYSRQLESIVQSCLCSDPDQRPTPSALIEKSKFYIKHEFWPVEKTERKPAWVLFKRHLDDIGSGLNTQAGRLASGAYSLRKPILRTAAVLLLFFIVTRNYDRVRRYMASIKPVPDNGSLARDRMTAPVDTARIRGASASTEGTTEGSAPIAQVNTVSQETVAKVPTAPLNRNASTTSNPESQSPVSTVGTERTVSEKIQAPPEEILPRQNESKPTVVAQSESKGSPDPVVNIEKSVAKPERENAPPVITFSQNRYTVFNSQNQLLISGVATDDGSISSYEWSQGDNPSRVEFKDLRKGNTIITNINQLKAGKYTLILTVTDNEGLKVTKDIELIVRMSRN